MLALKFIHLAALTIWVASLIYLPAMLSAYSRIRDQQDFVRARISGRFIYLIVASPAACITIASGTALLFVSDVRHPWMLVKLCSVGVLAICHYRFGSLLASLAESGPEIPLIRARAIGAFAGLAAAAAIAMVLAKPVVDYDPFPSWMREPAGILNLRSSQDHSG